MTERAWLQLGLYVALILALAPPIGRWMARVYTGERHVLQHVLGPLERLCYRLAGVDPAREQRWTAYTASVLLFSAAGFLFVYLIERAQGMLPLDPAGLGGVPAALAFNTAVSFATNTNWQAYAGETTMSHLTQMVALTSQNFASAATGMAVLVALTRGIARRSAETIGNFWVDLVRGTLYVLLPLATLLALFLAGAGVVQTFRGSVRVAPLDAASSTHATQTIALGPVASQEAIKQLGTNGGGFFNTNSAHPFENPNAATDLAESLAILLLPAALCFTFGRLVGDRRQGWALFAAMLVVFVPLVIATTSFEQRGTPALERAGAQVTPTAESPGGNMEGKEARFGIASSALWAVATTAASNGSVNSMHDSYTPLGGLVPLWLIQLGEVIFGGVGSGLYGLVMFAVIAVFVAGLMVGRTPEYLGKKIEAYEMKMAALVVLVPAIVVLVGTAGSLLVPAARIAVQNPGPHGFSELLYAFSSAGDNNGSAFAGLNANIGVLNVALGTAMVLGRFWTMIPVLAIAGSLAKKKRIPSGSGTLPTHTPLFVALLLGTALLVGALTFFPALTLGPIVEHLQMVGTR